MRTGGRDTQICERFRLGTKVLSAAYKQFQTHGDADRRDREHERGERLGGGNVFLADAYLPEVESFFDISAAAARSHSG